MIIITIALFALGWFLADAFDKKFISNKCRPLEGEALTGLLRNNDVYEDLKNNQKAISHRSYYRDNHNSRYVGEPRNGGNGARVLQIDKRQKMR